MHTATLHIEKPMDLSDLPIKIYKAILEEGAVELTLSPRVEEILRVYYNKPKHNNVKGA